MKDKIKINMVKNEEHSYIKGIVYLEIDTKEINENSLTLNISELLEKDSLKDSVLYIEKAIAIIDDRPINLLVFELNSVRVMEYACIEFKEDGMYLNLYITSSIGKLNMFNNLFFTLCQVDRT